MPRLDSIIDKMLKMSAFELVLETGAGVMLRTAEGLRPVSQQPLATPQIVQAFAEICPLEMRGTFPPEGTTQFSYVSPSGPVTARFDRTGNIVRGVIEPASIAAASVGADVPSPAPKGAAQKEPAQKEPAPTAPAPPAPVATPSRIEIRVSLPADPHEAISRLMSLMLERKASDLHLSSNNVPMLRLDGDIVPIEGTPVLTHEKIKEMLWTIAPERNKVQWEEMKDTDFAHETSEARFRVNFFADRFGIGSVMRQIPTKVMSAEEMALSKHILDLCFLTKGLVLVTGPTGSGKSTTLAAMIDYINRHREDHILTIEDPVEFVHPNKKCLVNQREVGVHTQSFKNALRAALREDPDIVLVGELRDLETIAIAIETAETGHLVFGTLHTNTAPSTIDRIIDQFPTDRQEQIRMMLSESLKGVVSQVLCKRIGGGRAPALEVLICTSAIANLIREGKTFQIPSAMQTGRNIGMQTLNDSLLDLVKRELVEPKEAYMKAVSKTEFKMALERNGFKLDAAAGEGPAAAAAPAA